jgi:hypothetical protein
MKLEKKAINQDKMVGLVPGIAVNDGCAALPLLPVSVALFAQKPLEAGPQG